MSLFPASAYHQHAKIRKVPSHAKNCCLQILLMPRQVNESYDFCGFLTDLSPFQASAMAVRLVHNVALAVKAQDVIAHAAGTARLNLVLVTEELLPGKTTAIVQLSVGKDT